MNLACTSLPRFSMDPTECVFCASRPLTVRNLGCGHATFCELCTIGQVKATGLKCAYRCGAVTKLAVVTGIIMPTYRATPEPESIIFESVDEFLQAKLQSDDPEVAEAAKAALQRVSWKAVEEHELWLPRSLSDDSPAYRSLGAEGDQPMFRSLGAPYEEGDGPVFRSLGSDEYEPVFRSLG